MSILGILGKVAQAWWLATSHITYLSWKSVNYEGQVKKCEIYSKVNSI